MFVRLLFLLTCLAAAAAAAPAGDGEQRLTMHPITLGADNGGGSAPGGRRVGRGRGAGAGGRGVQARHNRQREFAPSLPQSASLVTSSSTEPMMRTCETPSARGKAPDLSGLCPSGFRTTPGYCAPCPPARRFFFYFEAREEPETAPVVLWMTGGPGCSSELAVFFEMGPWEINKDMTVSETKYGWDVRHHMIFIDQVRGSPEKPRWARSHTSALACDGWRPPRLPHRACIPAVSPPPSRPPPSTPVRSRSTRVSPSPAMTGIAATRRRVWPTMCSTSWESSSGRGTGWHCRGASSSSLVGGRFLRFPHTYHAHTHTFADSPPRPSPLPCRRVLRGALCARGRLPRLPCQQEWRGGAAHQPARLGHRQRPHGPSHPVRRVRRICAEPRPHFPDDARPPEDGGWLGWRVGGWRGV